MNNKFRNLYTKLKVEKNQKLELTIDFVGREKSKEKKMLMRELTNFTKSIALEPIYISPL